MPFPEQSGSKSGLSSWEQGELAITVKARRLSHTWKVPATTTGTEVSLLQGPSVQIM